VSAGVFFREVASLANLPEIAFSSSSLANVAAGNSFSSSSEPEIAFSSPSLASLANVLTRTAGTVTPDAAALSV